MGGLMDYKARFYSPYLNHFIQPDTIVPDPSNPQAFNRFGYVHNNPINFNDPSGHARCDEDGNCMVGNKSTLGIHAEEYSHNWKPKLKPPVCSSSMCNPNTPVETPNPVCTSSMCNPDLNTPTWYSRGTEFVQDVLGNAATPLAMDAIQVLTGRIMTISLAASLVPGAGQSALGIYALAWIANRATAMIGFAATLYQAENDLNGTRDIDATISGIALVAGFIVPTASEDIAIFMLFYDGKNYISSNQ